MTTACAPNTHQRPHRSATGASAVRSSTAAGCTSTTKTFGKSGVEGQIGLARIGIRPAGITLEHLTPEIIRDTEALECTETPDALAPVLLLAPASGLPVADDELADPSGDHAGIVRPPLA